MEFLKLAEQYAEVRGDDMWFKDVYAQLREFHNVNDSVWKTLSYLYGSYIADRLELELVWKIQDHVLFATPVNILDSGGI